MVGETGAARRAASSASGPAPKLEVDCGCCWAVDMVVLVEDGLDEWIGRVVVLFIFEEARV